MKIRVATLVVALFLLVGGIAAYIITRDRDESLTTTSEQTSDSQPVRTFNDSQSVSEQKARNAARLTDVTATLSAVNQFTANYNGKVPTAWDNGSLVSTDGSKTAVTLKQYKSVDVAQGEQAAILTDTIRLVTAATCGPKGATIASASTRSVAVQFAQEAASGLEPACNGN